MCITVISIFNHAIHGHRGLDIVNTIQSQISTFITQSIAHDRIMANDFYHAYQTLI